MFAHTYLHLYMSVCTCEWVAICTSPCVPIHLPVYPPHPWLNTNLFNYLPMDMQKCVSDCTYTSMRTYTSLCVPIHILYTYLCTCNIYIHRYIHISMYIYVVYVSYLHVYLNTYMFTFRTHTPLVPTYVPTSLFIYLHTDTYICT